MRVILHCLSYDVGNLVVTAVIYILHGVHDTPLHRLEAVRNVRNCTFQNYIRCVIQKPVLVHSGKLVLVLTVLYEFPVLAGSLLLAFQNLLYSIFPLYNLVFLHVISSCNFYPFGQVSI